MNAELASLIQTHLERYPAMEISDVYKLLHHAAFGPGVPDISAKHERDWMEHEFKVTRPTSNERLIEEASPNNQWVRLHLRPYIAAGGTLDALLETFLKSSKIVDLDPKRMVDYWETFEVLVNNDVRIAERLNRREVALYRQVVEQQMWPAVHHSPAYFKAYNPVYRVLNTDLANQLVTAVRG
jgi:hypothetical protein